MQYESSLLRITRIVFEHRQVYFLVAKMSGDHKTLIKGSPSQYVKLNVGGTLFYTTIGTLTKSDNMLRTMFSGRMEVLTDSEGMRSLFYLMLLSHIFICAQ